MLCSKPAPQLNHVHSLESRAAQLNDRAADINETGIMICNAAADAPNVMLVNDTWVQLTGIHSETACAMSLWQIFELRGRLDHHHCRLRLRTHTEDDRNRPLVREKSFALSSTCSSLTGHNTILLKIYEDSQQTLRIFTCGCKKGRKSISARNWTARQKERCASLRTPLRQHVLLVCTSKHHLYSQVRALRR